MWPPIDQERFERMLSTGGLFDDAGAGADWAQPTLRRYEWSYGRWLQYLHASGHLDPAEDPIRRTDQWIAGYVELLQAQVASRTVWSFVDALHRVLYAMFPARKAELAFLRRIVGRLHARVIPARPIEPDLIHPDRFERVAYAGTDAAERAAAHGAPTKARQMAAESADPILCASRFRDYLLLALQGACGLRLRNLAMMRIGTHLVQHDTDSDRFWVLFRPTETKNRKEIHKPLPRKLTPYLRRYLEHHRLVLLRQGDGSAEEQALWITQYGRPLSADGINRRLAILTRRHFGRTLRSHRFRHCLASFMAIEAPSKAAAVPALLGNGLAAAERYYIRGQQVASRLSHLKTIAELRSAARQAHAGSREPADGPPTRRRRRPRCAR